MGTCNYISAECQKLKKEVNVQSLLNNSPHLLRQDISTSKQYSTLIYLQIRIRRFLKRKKNEISASNEA